MKVSPVHSLTYNGPFSCLITKIGECTAVMKSYLECIKKVRGVNEDQCRNLAKSYLACRMDQ
jgi:hypothetical protein